MSERESALAQIATLARKYKITPAEIAEAINGPLVATKSRALRFFSYIGGVFIFSGISAFIGMFWDDMNAAAHVVITLGTGFALFVMGLLTAKSTDARYRKASAPMMLMAAFLQPTGLFVLLHEYFPSGHDLRYACLFVFGTMLIQQLASFCAVRRPILLFFSLVFGSGLFSTAFSLLHVANDWNAMIIGLSLLNIAYALSRSEFRGMAGFWFFVSGAYFLGGSFAIAQHSPIELLYLALACFMIYVSTIVRSTALMIVSVLAMLAYIGYFTEEHFVRSTGWPAALIMLGLVFLGIGAGAVKLKRKYL
jgi:hypothetical protein